MAGELAKIGEQATDGPLDQADSSKLCAYTRLLATVSKDRREDEPDEGLTPKQLTEKAELLIRGMKAARR